MGSSGRSSSGGGGFRGTWDVGTAYAVGDIAVYGGAAYGATSASTGTTPVAVTDALSGTPADTAVADGADYELGCRFSVSAPARLTAVRYYKSANQSQSPHTLKVWDIEVSTTAPVASAPATGETGAATGVHAAPMVVDLRPGRTYYATLATGTGTDSGYCTTTGVTLPITVGVLTIDAFLFSGTIGNVTTVTTGTTSYWVWPRWEEPASGWQLLGRSEPAAAGSDRVLHLPVAPA